MCRHPLKLATAVGLALLITALVGCSGASSGGPTATGGASSPGASSGAPQSATTVTEQNFAFSPASLTVKVGDTVTFTNADSVPHNVKIDGQELGAQNQGESKTWKASKAGSFPYVCTIHPSMTGEITVK